MAEEEEAAIVLGFERACHDLQVPDRRELSEKQLLDFASQANCLVMCRVVLERSQSSAALFQASRIIKDTVAKNSPCLSNPDRQQLFSYTMQLVLKYLDGIEAFVRRQLSAVAAVLMKRMWLEDDNQHNMLDQCLSQIETTCKTSDDPKVRMICVEVLESIVTEFSPTTATPMSLTRDMHKRAAVYLENNGLKPMFVIAITLAMAAAEPKPGSNHDDHYKLCLKCLGLASAILNWNFSNSESAPSGLDGNGTDERAEGSAASESNRFNTLASSFGGASSTKGGGRDDDDDDDLEKDTVLIDPGPKWVDIIQVLNDAPFHIYEVIKKTPGMAYLGQACRGLVVQVSGLHGEIFSQDVSYSRDIHLQSCLNTCLKWISDAFSAVKASGSAADIDDGTSEEIVDACRILSTLCIIHPLRAIEKCNSEFGSALAIASKLCLEANALRDPDDNDYWAVKSLNYALEAWEMALRSDFFVPSSVICQAASDTFIAYGKAMLIEAVRSTQESWDEEQDDDIEFMIRNDPLDDDGRGEGFRASTQLQAVGMVGRAAALPSISWIRTQLEDMASKMQSLLGQGHGPVPPESQEQIYAVVSLAGHLMTDNSQGEVPEIPHNIVEHTAAACDVQSIIQSIGLQSIASPARQTWDLSARTLQGFVWFLARWTRSYMVTVDDNQNLEKPVAALLSEQLHKTLKELVVFAVGVFQGWPGEVTLHRMVCGQLLPAMVERPSTCDILFKSQEWHELLAAFSQKYGPMASLESKSVQKLAQSMSFVPSAIESLSHDEVVAYLASLLQPFVAELESICKLHRSEIVAPSTQQRSAYAFDVLRGALCSAKRKSCAVLYSALAQSVNNICLLFEAYQDHPAMVNCILRLAGTAAEVLLVYLGDEEARHLFVFFIRLEETYSKSESARIFKDTGSSSLLRQQAHEKYKAIKNLLELLNNVSSHDIPERRADIAKVLVLGIQIAVPLLDEETLKLPKLCHLYFDLVLQLFQSFPEQAMAMQDSFFLILVNSLAYGVIAKDSYTQSKCLGAITSLAEYVLQGSSDSGAKLHLRIERVNSSHDLNLLGQLLEYILKQTLLADRTVEFVNQASGTVLALTLAQPRDFQAIMQSVFSEFLSTTALHQQLDAIFQPVISALSAADLSFQSRKLFRKIFVKAVLQYRDLQHH